MAPRLGLLRARRWQPARVRTTRSSRTASISPRRRVRPEVTEIADVGGGDVALTGTLRDAGLRWRRRDRRDAVDPRPLLRPPARGAGRRASGGRAGADARRRHRRARAARDAFRFAAGGREQRGRPRRAADRGAALRGGAGAGRRRDRRGPSWAPDGPIARRNHGGARGALARAVGRRARRLPRRRRRARSSTSSRFRRRADPRSSTARPRRRPDRRAGVRGRARRCWRSSARTTSLLLDTTSPLRPARSAPRPLPTDVRRAHDRRRRPVARRQAAGGRHRRRQPRRAAGPGAARARGPGRRDCRSCPRSVQSVLVDVAFSPDGDTLWVLSGDTPRSRAGRPAADGAARDAARRQPGEPERSSRSRAWSRSERRDGSGADRRSGARCRWSAAPRSACRPSARRCSSRPAVGQPRTATRRGGRPHPVTRRRRRPLRNEAAVFRVGVEDAATVAIAAVGAAGSCPTCRSTAAGCWRRRGRRWLGARAVGRGRRPAGARDRRRSTSSGRGPGETAAGGRGRCRSCASSREARPRDRPRATCRASAFAPRPRTRRGAWASRAGCATSRRQRRGRGGGSRRGRRWT